MKRIYLILFVGFLLSSCSETEKGSPYYYKETNPDRDKLYKSETYNDTIYAETDSIAYLKAYRGFLISKSVNKRYLTSVPIDFELYNEQGVEISNTIRFQKMDSILTSTEVEIEKFMKKNADESASKKYTTSIYSDDDIDHQFSKWDGAHIKTEEYVKEHMKNPDSYEHVTSKYKIRTDYLDVVLTYRGTNSFGAIVTESVNTYCDLDSGEVIRVIEN